MSVRKSDDFIADVGRQYEWYVCNADWEVADRYLAAVEATFRWRRCNQVEQEIGVDA